MSSKLEWLVSGGSGVAHLVRSVALDAVVAFACCAIDELDVPLLPTTFDVVRPYGVVDSRHPYIFIRYAHCAVRTHPEQCVGHGNFLYNLCHFACFLCVTLL